MSDQKTKSIVYGPEAGMQESHASSCGKAIIVGEHAVVYGSQAVAMPLKQLRMSIHLKPVASHNHSSDNPHRLILGGKEVSNRVADVIPDAFSLITSDVHAVEIKGHSDVPIGAGLGSSASLCIAMLKAVAASSGKVLSKKELADFGNRLEARFHGNPSGLDTAVVAYEECISFRKGHPPKVIATSSAKPWKFALIDTNVRASTLSMIRIAEPFFKGSQGETRLQLFEDLASGMVQALESSDHLSAAEIMRSCHRLLQLAGVVPESLQEMILELENLGVLAAKVTGAGGGGTILCLLHPERAIQDFAKIQNFFPDYKSVLVDLD